MIYPLFPLDGQIEEVKRLIGEEENVNATNGFNMTALSFAAKGGFQDIIYVLVKNGQADMEIKNGEGQSALAMAAFHEKWDAYDELVELGADKGSVNIFGNTPEDIKKKKGPPAPTATPPPAPQPAPPATPQATPADAPPANPPATPPATPPANPASEDKDQGRSDPAASAPPAKDPASTSANNGDTVDTAPQGTSAGNSAPVDGNNVRATDLAPLGTLASEPVGLVPVNTLQLGATDTSSTKLKAKSSRPSISGTGDANRSSTETKEEDNDSSSIPTGVFIACGVVGALVISLIIASSLKRKSSSSSSDEELPAVDPTLDCLESSEEDRIYKKSDSAASDDSVVSAAYTDVSPTNTNVSSVMSLVRSPSMGVYVGEGVEDKSMYDDSTLSGIEDGEEISVYDGEDYQDDYDTRSSVPSCVLTIVPL